jgi:nucleotide-binding universal stress UspA family protein
MSEQRPSERAAANPSPARHERRVVLAALDDSAAALPVIHVGARLARTLGAELRVVHVGEEGTHSAQAVAAHIGSSIEILEGDPAERIAQASKAADVAIVVVGARGHRGGRRPCGHVATAVLEHASRPVVLVSPDLDPMHRDRFERVLIPLEGSEESTAGVAAEARAFADSGAKITVVHVFRADTMPRFLDHAGHAEQSWGTEFLAQWYIDHDVELHLRSGHVPHAILDVAAAEDIDLIALAWSRTMERDHAKVVREILSRSDVPVLLAPI